MQAPSRPGVRAITRRLVPLLAADALLCAAALYAALVLRFEGDIPPRYREVYGATAACSVAAHISLLWVFGLYRVQWRYASLRDLVKVGYATGLAALALAAILGFVHFGPFLQVLPRTVIVIQLLLSTLLLGGLRILPRWIAHLPPSTFGRRPALIYGAGAAGEQLVRDMLRHAEYPTFPVAFIDDDARKHGTTIHGLRVVGGADKLGNAAEQLGTDILIVASPSLDAPHVRRIVDRARDCGIRDVRIVPGLARIVRGEVTVSQIREVDLEDLMGREPVVIDTAAIEGYLRGRRVLVTGAAGSIGSSLARLLLEFSPARLCLLDHDETEIVSLADRLRREHKEAPLDARIGDVRDAARMRAVIAAFAPQVVFHAAAYKHVPILETHPTEAVRTNVLGTRNVARAAAEAGCEKFILISTDKAVNPTSVMGVSKRIAEQAVRLAGARSTCRFAAVRFGNVLGSRGSVVPIFREQLARGGPVTVTDPEMKRYFMTIHEACLLVLQAAALSAGGEVMVLDMGEPVKIVDLAREMIRLSGLRPDVDIPVAFTGVRPGEKLFEEYLTAEEGVDATRHAKIFVARAGGDALPALTPERLAEIEEACASDDETTLRRLFRDLVPSYTPTAPSPAPAAAQGTAGSR